MKRSNGYGAHDDAESHHPVQKEQVAWGMAGDSPSVRRPSDVCMRDDMRFASYQINVRLDKTGEVVWTLNRADAFELDCLLASHHQASMVGACATSPDDPGAGLNRLHDRLAGAMDWKRMQARCPLSWFYLIFAGCLEIGWPVGLKLAQEPATRWLGVALATAFMLMSGFFLWLAQRDIPMGTAYAVWTGIGATGTFLVGVFVYGDPASMLRYLGVLLIVLGVIALKMAG